jgi:uncharacterized protein (DUF1330 family)
MSSHEQPITLGFVGYANSATAERASAYEDEVLRLLESYGARLLYRGRRTHDQDQSLPLEIQLMSFPRPHRARRIPCRRTASETAHQVGDVFTLKHAVELETLQPLTL